MLSLGINSVLKALSLILSLYLTQWLFRHISSADLAGYNVAIAYMGAISLFVGFGITTTIQKWYTNTTDAVTRANVWTTLWYVRAATFFVGVELSLLVTAVVPTVSTALICLLFLANFIIICDYSFSALYNVRQEAWKFSVTDFAGKLLVTSLLVAYSAGVWTSPSPLYDFVIIVGSGSLLTLCLDALWLRNDVTKGQFDANLLRTLLPGMALVGFSGLLVGIYQYSQPIFMKQLGTSDQDINGFAKAFTFVSQVNFAIGSVIPQFASSLKSRLTQNTPARAQQIFVSTTVLSTIGLVIVYLLMQVMAPFYFGFVDPQNKYPLGQSLFPVLAVFVIPSALATLVSYLSVFAHQEKWHFWVIVIQLIVGVGMMAILIPQQGTWGAVWSIVAVSLIDALALRIPHFLVSLRTTTLPHIDSP